MTVAGTDPRSLSKPASAVRPTVAKPQRTLPGWLLIAVGLVFALLLFIVLENRREARIAPVVRARASDLARMPAVPQPLYIPPEIPGGSPPPLAAMAPPPQISTPPRLPSPVMTPSQIAPVPIPPPIQPQPMFQNAGTPQLPRPRQTSGGSPLVIDTTAAANMTNISRPASGSTGSEGDAALAPGSTGKRVQASQFANPATTVPQGRLIPAVLETAIDSTRPGQVRALVSRDVLGFDGSQVLIPRGSRLFGEYRADLRAGQNRAFVQWTRLVRPDGVSIAVGSPAADPLGRAGIRGKVDSHFFERFGSAILQSTLDLGLAVGTRRLGGSNVLLLPGAGQVLRSGSQPSIQPTLTVKQGSRVTVFVANDLDFTMAGATVR
jgi:type IV secretion system protein VirB10